MQEVFMEPDGTATLEALARSYVWWTPPDRVVREDLDYLIAQVMDLGTWEDIARLRSIVGNSRFVEVYTSPHGKRLSARSRAFWSARLGVPLAVPTGRSIPGAAHAPSDA
jgi:hypothetical protein